jgi:GNAT superfamily N-acetyltransferase
MKENKQYEALQIVAYRPEFRDDFRRLNVRWLEEYFFVTSEDEAQLGQPEKILASGGMIFFALLNERAVGTVAAVPDDSGGLEIAKMGVAPELRGKGIGSLLLDRALRWAVAGNFTVIHLDTAGRLTAAIHLYERAGFSRVGPEHEHPVFRRTTFRMELSEEAIQRYR